MIHRNQMLALAGAIERVRTLDMPADAALSAYFKAHGEMGARDRAFVSDGAFAYLRRKASLETLAETDDPRLLANAV
ncbi:MAG TPA: SAM-dependent methyltransferase, partial [Casimicrobiaceae bacterium]